MPDKTQRIRSLPLTVRINAGRSIGVHRSVLRALGCPNNIFFWWGEDEKVLMIGADHELGRQSIPIKEYCYKVGGCSFVSTNKKLLNALQKLTGWPCVSKHMIVGRYIPEINMVAFKTAESITEVSR